ncbi:hypothetical protein ELUMI_v1c04950 [Williamsoniiplasma luminosum]|uniref:SprT-like domain-containing protein n=1 Tax=Williamsoniiplasma luminosum TaxID=214888 RepID=A0A2K8NTV0_9MOLU|nr:SprT-like domain-containing protein [Williamsoniiplasma luminosum]ATZ17219.1 hypothetical protein ELUMI_v1c04950 [Williamsoniiplasma luminosum]
MENKLIDSTNLIKTFNDLHAYLNEKHFKNKLGKAVITIVSNPKNKRVFGHYTNHPVWNEKYHEIVLHGLVFNGNPAKVTATLFHEMIHQYCSENNIHDVESNGRHNKNFKKHAEEFGLTVLKPNNKNIGYKTELDEKLWNDISTNSNIDFKVLEDYINSFNVDKFKNSNTNNGQKPVEKTPKPLGKKDLEIASLKFEVEELLERIKILEIENEYLKKQDKFNKEIISNYENKKASDNNLKDLEEIEL